MEAEVGWRNRYKARSVRHGPWKLIHTPFQNDMIQLFNLDHDPRESHNLAVSTHPDHMKQVQFLKEQLDAWADSANPRESGYEKIHEDDTREALKALGYY